jgi:hypothetical protein
VAGVDQGSVEPPSEVLILPGIGDEGVGHRRGSRVT